MSVIKVIIGIDVGYVSFEDILYIFHPCCSPSLIEGKLDRVEFYCSALIIHKHLKIDK